MNRLRRIYFEEARIPLPGAALKDADLTRSTLMQDSLSRVVLPAIHQGVEAQGITEQTLEAVFLRTRFRALQKL